MTPSGPGASFQILLLCTVCACFENVACSVWLLEPFSGDLFYISSQSLIVPFHCWWDGVGTQNRGRGAGQSTCSVPFGLLGGHTRPIRKLVPRGCIFLVPRALWIGAFFEFLATCVKLFLFPHNLCLLLWDVIGRQMFLMLLVQHTMMLCFPFVNLCFLEQLWGKFVEDLVWSIRIVEADHCAKQQQRKDKVYNVYCVQPE